MHAIVSIRNLSKAFAGVRALDNVQFELLPGEVHALMGENGAGKSTLLKVLAGIYPQDAGRILFKGQPVDIPTPRAARDMGISIIHQELSLMRHLTVAQNIFIGREPRTSLGIFLDEDRINNQTQDLLDRLNIKLSPRARVADLIRSALITPRRRRPTRATLGARRRRLDDKKQRGAVKRWRSRPADAD